MTPVNLGKNLKYLKTQEAYDLKISQNIIYVKEYFYMFFLPWKILYRHKVKQIIELAKTLWLFA